jgi:hypothetical protein
VEHHARADRNSLPAPLAQSVRPLARTRFHHPVHVAFDEPVAFRRIVEQAGYNPAKVTEVLERDSRQRGL